MRKTKSGKFIKRDSATGQFIVETRNDKTVTAKYQGVSATSSSARRAKAMAKVVATYNANVVFISESDKHESDSAVSVKSKSREKLESKYKNIHIKKG